MFPFEIFGRTQFNKTTNQKLVLFRRISRKIVNRLLIGTINR